MKGSYIPSAIIFLWKIIFTSNWKRAKVLTFAIILPECHNKIFILKAILSKLNIDIGHPSTPIYFMWKLIAIFFGRS